VTSTSAILMSSLSRSLMPSFTSARISIPAVSLTFISSATFPSTSNFERAFVREGGLLVAGLDPTGNGGIVAGFGDLRGVELLVEEGFTPMEAIKIASLNGARFLGEDARIGSIAVGKQADLMVVKGNPAANIGDI